MLLKVLLKLTSGGKSPPLTKTGSRNVRNKKYFKIRKIAVEKRFVMSRSLLNVKFVKEENAQKFAHACYYAENEVTVFLKQDTIASVEKAIKKLEKQSGKEDAISAKKQEISELETEISALEAEKAQWENAYNEVIKGVVSAGNSEEVIIRILRIIASAKNNKLLKYAVKDIQDVELYEAMETVHITSSANENGGVKQTVAVKEAYKQAKNRLGVIVKDKFSLSFENEFTEKVNVKLNSGDVKMIHDCYVTGVKNDYDSDKAEKIDFKGTREKTCVRVKVDKKTGDKTYNMEALLRVIATIVIGKYCK